jgi:hypothetical protein
VTHDIIHDLKERLSETLQPKGFAFYGGEKKFVRGQGMSILTEDFEDSLRKYRVDSLQVFRPIWSCHAYTFLHIYASILRHISRHK